MCVERRVWVSLVTDKADISGDNDDDISFSQTKRRCSYVDSHFSSLLLFFLPVECVRSLAMSLRSVI